MIDLHTHSIWSDGVLIPAELMRRAEHIGYEAVAITDHVDISNMDLILTRIVEFCKWYNRLKRIKAIPGIELTHIPPEAIPGMADKARGLGASLIVVHGETIAEPVIPGTNSAAIESDIDILAHPGLLTEQDARVAASRGVLLEITTRRGHSLANGHVAGMARRFGAKLVINTDSHAPEDLVSRERAYKIAQGAGLVAGEIDRIFDNANQMVEKALSR